MSGDHDADAIRNRRQGAAAERLLALVPRIEAMFAAIDGDGRETDEFGKQAFELGNRVEEALAHHAEKMRELGDLPDRLRGEINKAEDLNAKTLGLLEELGKSLEQNARSRENLMKQLLRGQKPENQAQAPGTNGTGGQDGPGAEKLASGQNSGASVGLDPVHLAPNDPRRIEAENKETLRDVDARTAKPEPTGSPEQAAVQALPDGPKVEAAENADTRV